VKAKEKNRWVDFIRDLHPSDLHRHMDGSIRPSTLWGLSEKYYKAIPGMDFTGFERMLRYDPDKDGTLLHYLDKFHVPLQYTQFYDNIQTIAFEIAEDAYVEGVRVLEVRVNPVIHRRAGLTTRQVITAILSGFKLSMDEHPDYITGLIVIAMRNHGGNMAKILLREIAGEKEVFHSGPGVVGFDIAGAERPFPPVLFREAYALAKRMGLKRTVHVGEDAGPDKIWQAVDILGPDRLGHAVSAHQDPELLRRLARDRILVEVCLTSNLQTGAVSDLRNHPLPVFLEYGVPCTLCTDNTTVSSTGLIQEYLLAIETFGLGEKEVQDLVDTGLKHSFCRR
jgi:adenosine deaminase